MLRFPTLAAIAALSTAVYAQDGTVPVSGADSPTADVPKLSIGDKAPKPQLKKIVKGEFPDEFEKDTVYVVEFWATWCPPCRREMPDLERLGHSLDPQRFAVIGLSVDEDEHGVREYLNDKGITFARFIDKDLKIARDLLGVSVYPTTILIAPDGTLIGRMVGPRQWESRAMHDLLRDAFDGKPVRLEDIPVYAG